jgi:superfamily I DNA and/or RNA helicase
MKAVFVCFIAILSASSWAQSSLNQYKALAEKRTTLTAEFAKVQNQLKSSEPSSRKAGENSLSDLSQKVDSLTSDLITANKALIEAFNYRYVYRLNYYSDDLFFGAYDPSATIVSSLGKLLLENRELTAITLPNNPPFSPQDINKFQVKLDRLKRAIDEHRHAANNYATTVLQRQRKRAEPAKKPAKLPE